MAFSSRISKEDSFCVRLELVALDTCSAGLTIPKNKRTSTLSTYHSMTGVIDKAITAAREMMRYALADYRNRRKGWVSYLLLVGREA